MTAYEIPIILRCIRNGMDLSGDQFCLDMYMI